MQTIYPGVRFKITVEEKARVSHFNLFFKIIDNNNNNNNNYYYYYQH